MKTSPHSASVGSPPPTSVPDLVSPLTPLILIIFLQIETRSFALSLTSITFAGSNGVGLGQDTVNLEFRGGICIRAASYPGNTACVRSGVNFGSLSRGSGVKWTVVDFLRGHSDEQITALSWSPDGRYVASASYGSSSFTILDAAQGVGTPMRRGFKSISLLKWSPTRGYFFFAKCDGTFYLWETNTWTSELFS